LRAEIENEDEFVLQECVRSFGIMKGTIIRKRRRLDYSSSVSHHCLSLLADRRAAEDLNNCKTVVVFPLGSVVSLAVEKTTSTRLRRSVCGKVWDRDITANAPRLAARCAEKLRFSGSDYPDTNAAPPPGPRPRGGDTLRSARAAPTPSGKPRKTELRPRSIADPEPIAGIKIEFV
jgi:hypothetical protein